MTKLTTKQIENESADLAAADVACWEVVSVTNSGITCVVATNLTEEQAKAQVLRKGARFYQARRS